MHMWFWTSYNVGTLLFDGLVVKSVWALIAVCFGLGALSFLFEFLRYLQTVHRQKELLLRSKQIKNLHQGEVSTLLPDQKFNILERQTPDIPTRDRLFIAVSDLLLWFLILILAYFLMLAVMTYNLWIFLSILFGGGLGYYVFGQMFMKVNLQNCKIIRDLLCKTQCESVTPKTEGESTPAVERTTTEIVESINESSASTSSTSHINQKIGNIENPDTILPSNSSNNLKNTEEIISQDGQENAVIVHAENS